ncbi:esterase/lipase family protein [Streptomyces sp. URMC 126]|uniref:esterase/lipase family protein n=1 Tax=Streptomyces sp. URMC 126 TaxID=3423401 RepID=UPI003F1D2038
MITAVAVVTAGVWQTLAAPAAQAREGVPGPVLRSWTAAVAYALLHPDADTPGGNDFHCAPSREHPRPVVLVHGMFENRYDNWTWMAPQIAAAGYCVYAPNYGHESRSAAGRVPGVNGTEDIRVSSRELAVFVDRVRAVTGANQVDIVGHSLGGVVPRQYLKFDGGRGKVHTLVSLGATNHGTDTVRLAALGEPFGLGDVTAPLLGPSFAQQATGSSFLRELNAGGDTVSGVHYTSIATRHDLLSTPYRTAFLTAGPGATVENITLQDGCEADLSSHTSMVTSNRSVDLVLNALDPAHPRPVRCEPHAPEA